MKKRLCWMVGGCGLALGTACAGERPDFGQEALRGADATTLDAGDAGRANRTDGGVTKRPDAGAQKQPDAATTQEIDVEGQSGSPWDAAPHDAASVSSGDATTADPKPVTPTSDGGTTPRGDAGTQATTGEEIPPNDSGTPTIGSADSGNDEDPTEDSGSDVVTTDEPNSSSADDAGEDVNELVAVEVTLSSDELNTLAERATLEVTCEYEDGTAETCTDQATVNVSEPWVASLQPESGEFLPLTNGTTFITASVGGVTSEPQTLSVALGAICTVLHVVGETSIAAGTSVDWSASCDYDDGRTNVDVTSQVEWESSNESVAVVSSEGNVTAGEVGPTTITASLDNPDGNTKSIARNLTVTNGELVSITISALSDTSVPAGLAVSFEAQCEYTDVTSSCTEGVTWVSERPAIATVDSGGIATGNSLGVTEVSARLAGVTSNSLELTVTEPIVTEILITPSATVTVQIYSERQLDATCVRSDETSFDCSSDVTWTSSDESLSIDESGEMYGNFVGVALVHASLGDVESASITASVLPPESCREEIEFPDEVMETDVRQLLEKPAGAIYYEDVKDITSFEHNQNNGYLEFLTGIECFTSLETLSVERAWLASIQEIVGLKRLQRVSIAFTSVSWLPNLSELTELSDLNLTYTLVSDLGALVDATHFGAGDTVTIANDSLDCSNPSTIEQIQTLESRGASVFSNCSL